MSIFSSGIKVSKDMTISEQLQAAKLDWTVEVVPVIYKISNGDFIQSNSTNIAFRSDTGEELSSYGSTRKAYQNVDILATYNQFCEDNGLTIDRIGSLDGGKRIFCLTKLPVQVKPVKEIDDVTDAYLLLSEPHKHGKGTDVSVYFDRLWCTNGCTHRVKEFSKTTNHASSFNSARLTSTLELAYSKVAEYENNLKVLTEVTMSYDEAVLLLIKNFGTINLPLSEQPKIVQTSLRLFEQDAKGGHLLTAYQTAYGLLQAVTEFTSHHSKATQTQVSSQLYGSLSLQNNKMYNSLLSIYSSADIASAKVPKVKQAQTVRAW